MSFTIADVERIYAGYIPSIMEGLRNYGDFEKEELSLIFADLSEGELNAFVDFVTVREVQNELSQTVKDHVDKTIEECIAIAIDAYSAKHNNHPSKSIMRKMISANTLNYVTRKKEAIPVAKKLVQETLYYSPEEANTLIDNMWVKYILDMTRIAPLLSTQFHSCIIDYNRTFDDCKSLTPFESGVRQNHIDTRIFIDLLAGAGLAAQKDRLEELGRNNHVTVTIESKRLAIKSLKKYLYFNSTEATNYVRNAQGHHVLEIPAMAPVVNSTFYRCLIGDFNSFDACQSYAAVGLYEIYQMMARKEDRQALLSAKGLFDKRDYFNDLARNASLADGNQYCRNPASICYDPAAEQFLIDQSASPTDLATQQASAASASSYLLFASFSVISTVAVLRATGNLRLLTQPVVKVGFLLSDAVKFGFTIFKTAAQQASRSRYSRLATVELDDDSSSKLSVTSRRMG